MYSNHLVSILIPVYNAASYVRQALESALAQSHKNIEIICCDDGSSDDSLAVVQAMAAECSTIQVAFNKQNQGVIETRNRLLALANGDFIAWLDADDFIHPDKIRQQLAFLAQHPSCGAVGTGITYVNSQGEGYKAESYSDDPDRQRIDPELCCASVLVRRKAAEQAGGFRAIFRFGGEDGDWLLRIGDYWQLRNLPASLYYYRKISDGISHRYQSEIRRLGVIARYAAKKRREIGVCPIDDGQIPSFTDDYFLESNQFTAKEQVVATTYPLRGEKPLVSIVMPYFNCPQFLVEALNALEEQTYQNFELIIYDDGSDKSLLKNAALLRYKNTSIYPISIERGAVNMGPAAARNRILDRVNGRFVLFHDADDISLPHRIECLLQEIVADPTCIAVGSAIQFVNRERRILRNESYDANAISAFSFSGCCGSFMYRFDANSTLRFNESLVGASEDVEFLLRLANYGVIRNIPDILYQYRLRDDSLTANETWQSSHTHFMLSYFSHQNGLDHIDKVPAFFRDIDGTQTGDLLVTWIWRSWRRNGGSRFSLVLALLIFRHSLWRAAVRKCRCKLMSVYVLLGKIRSRVIRAPANLIRYFRRAYRKILFEMRAFAKPRAIKIKKPTLLVRIIDCWGDAEESIRMLLPAEHCTWRSIKFTTCKLWNKRPDYYLILNQPDTDNAVVKAHPSRVLFAIGEPPTRAHRPLHDGQGEGTIIFTPDNHSAEREGNEKRRYIYSPCMTRTWSVKKNFDELVHIENSIVKSRKLSWITSNITLLPGHQRRLHFLETLRGHVEFDLFGRGFKPIADKWHALAPYEYSIAFENTIAPLYFTEKIMDCFVSMTVPFYYGSPEIDRYFPEKSFITINPDDPNVFHKIKDILNFDDYSARKNALLEAKNLVLTRYNMFVYLAEWIESQPKVQGNEITIPLKRHVIDWNLT